MPFERLVARRDRALARQVRLFGDGGWGRLFVVEPHRGLLGASLSEVEIGAAALDRAALDDEATRRLLGALSRERPFVPSPLTGYVEGSGARSGRALAVAVNGTIAAIAETYERGGTVKFSALAPESAFQTGANEVAFFWVDGAAGAETLTPLQNG
jgi:hypothetical protein